MIYKYMTEETLDRMLRLLGKELITILQDNSVVRYTYGVHPVTGEYGINPLKMDDEQYCIAVKECIFKLFYQLDFDEIDNMLSNEQLIDDIRYFQNVYHTDICSN